MKKILILLLLAQFTATAQRDGKDYAVFFYVTDFKPGWARLPETAKEAALLKTELETNFGFTCEMVPNPTKNQMTEKLAQYNNKLTPKDQVLYFFSMHGHYDEELDRGFLIAADGAVQDEYGKTWLSYDDLSGYLGRCKAKHVLLALDACHSGSFGIRSRAKPEQPRFSMDEPCLQRVSNTFRFKGRQFCSAGNKLDKTPAQSFFAARFLEALRVGGQEGLVRFDDIEYALGRVESPRPEQGTFKGHEPGGNFVFVRKNGCAATLSSIPAASPAPSTATTSASDQDKAAWQQTEATNTLEAYRKYLRECKLCLYQESAETAIARLNTSAEPVSEPPSVPNDTQSKIKTQDNKTSPTLGKRKKESTNDPLGAKPNGSKSAGTEQLKQPETKTGEKKKGGSKESAPASNLELGNAFLRENGQKMGVVTTPSGLQYRILKRENPNGLTPDNNDMVEVHYHGTNLDGSVFDSSVERQQSASFSLNQVIPGFAEGLQLMREGDKFKLFIPSNLAYGNRAIGEKIKPDSVLTFEIELIKVTKQ